MKKFLAMLCMITCIFGLTACGSEKVLGDATVTHMATAESLATTWATNMTAFFDDETANEFKEYNDAAAIEYIFLTNSSIYVEGTGIIKTIDSFNKGYESFGELVSVGDVSSELDGDEIIVIVEVAGSERNGEVEFIFDNDTFTTMKSCTLNVDSTFAEKMENAALNTILGMGTVFAILILISFIISLIKYIPQLISGKKIERSIIEKPEVKTTVYDNTIAQIIEKEELADNLELVAVISAAIAAYTGNTSTDGFVVRSIKKAKRTK